MCSALCSTQTSRERSTIPSLAATNVSKSRLPQRVPRHFLLFLLLLLGCSRFGRKPSAHYVYVTAKQTYLRDRVAAVSNRTATVTNGERLRVLELGHRFLRVATDRAETGWIDEKAIVTQEVFDQFNVLSRNHQKQASVATAVVRDEVNLHLTPGRDTEYFYRLGEGDKLQLLERASLLKPGGPAHPAAAPAQTVAAQIAAAKAATAPPPMEDWWLVRDAKGNTGWLLSRRIDVDEPDALTRYAEGQRIVGAYVLTTVNDPDAPQDIKDVPIYVAVLNPFKAGLPYDFDQVRVFTWNRAKHRYETAYRDHNVEGYLPIQITQSKDPYGKSPTSELDLPTFSYKVLAASAPEVTPDPITGAIVPGDTVTKTFRLEGNVVRRVLPPGPAPAEAHPAPPEKKNQPKRHKG